MSIAGETVPGAGLERGRRQAPIRLAASTARFGGVMARFGSMPDTSGGASSV
jgi:hypothetical protein